MNQQDMFSLNKLPVFMTNQHIHDSNLRQGPQIFDFKNALGSNIVVKNVPED